MPQPNRRTLSDFQYAIGRDPNNLADLKRLGVAWPDQAVFTPATVYYDRPDGSRVGDGFKMVSWIWDVISWQRLATLLEYLDGGEYAKVYIRTDLRDGTYYAPRTSYGVYYATMLKPRLTGAEGVPIARSPYAYQTVSIQFRNLIEQPGYL